MQVHTPVLQHFTRTTDNLDVTLAYGSRHTGHRALVAVSSILERHASCTYLSVHLHADLRGAGTLPVQMKHSGGSSSAIVGNARYQVSICTTQRVV